MILFSSISDAEVYTVLITVGLTPILFITLGALAIAYFRSRTQRLRKAILIVGSLLLVNSSILTLHQMNNNEPGLVLFVSVAMVFFAIVMLVLSQRGEKRS